MWNTAHKTGLKKVISSRIGWISHKVVITIKNCFTTAIWGNKFSIAIIAFTHAVID